VFSVRLSWAPPDGKDNTGAQGCVGLGWLE